MGGGKGAGAVPGGLGWYQEDCLAAGSTGFGSQARTTLQVAHPG